jgi:uncharacterized protein
MHLRDVTFASFSNAIRLSKFVNILPISPEIETEAYTVFEKCRHKDFSYTDCTSFATMEAEEIDSVFAYDNHFVQYGLQSVFGK